MRGPNHGGDRRYWGEIALVLTGKAVALLLLYLLFFAAPPAAPPIGDHVFLPGASR